MKIQHLLEYQFPDIKTVNVTKSRHPGQKQDNLIDRDRDENHIKSGSGTKFVGSGVFSTAYKNDKYAPHDVRKVSKPNDESRLDGFYFYIKALANFSDNTNPYFPRFRDIKIYVDQIENSITYSANMEHLYPISELSNSEINAIFSRIFGPEITLVNNEFDYELNPESRCANRHPLVKIINSAIHSDFSITKHVVDRDLLTALSFIKNLSNVKGLNIDLHGENIMYRKTPYGAQVVLSDPLGFPTED